MRFVAAPTGSHGTSSLNRAKLSSLWSPASNGALTDISWDHGHYREPLEHWIALAKISCISITGGVIDTLLASRSIPRGQMELHMILV
jgi:hypothetical protein